MNSQINIDYYDAAMAVKEIGFKLAGLANTPGVPMEILGINIRDKRAVVDIGDGFYDFADALGAKVYRVKRTLCNVEEFPFSYQIGIGGVVLQTLLPRE
ncbi:hypothetical protein [Eubacterium barkeri]|uniref:Uncharacterized protein n=1 Tax=Eubacterium barkeri TaxID=1528 RepID=A0A1H3BI33_EUBBA|nr:hypothetical protein [Eubacterium barkeri]SDX41378.1 hypothetical protein SAMN04488579_10282 [Eubacterium barkeri]